MGIGLDGGIETYRSDQRVVAGEPNFVFVFTPRYILVAELVWFNFLYENWIIRGEPICVWYTCGRGELLSILLFCICVAVNEWRMRTNQSINGFICFDMLKKLLLLALGLALICFLLSPSHT